MSSERFRFSKRAAILRAQKDFYPYLRHGYRIARMVGRSRSEALAFGVEYAATMVEVQVSKIRATSEPQATP